jgi:nitroreductase
MYIIGLVAVNLYFYAHNKGFESGYETGVITGYWKLDKPSEVKEWEKKHGKKLID